MIDHIIDQPLQGEAPVGKVLFNSITIEHSAILGGLSFSLCLFPKFWLGQICGRSQALLHHLCIPNCFMHAAI